MKPDPNHQPEAALLCSSPIIRLQGLQMLYEIYSTPTTQNPKLISKR
jgi:hypothetical protein